MKKTCVHNALFSGYSKNIFKDEIENFKAQSFYDVYLISATLVKEKRKEKVTVNFFNSFGDG